MELHFDSDMLSFAKHYFANPSYLHIEGRPVVYLYLTRTLDRGRRRHDERGADVPEGARVRDPFFIGDEVYWRVTPEMQVPRAGRCSRAAAGGRIERSTP